MKTNKLGKWQKGGDRLNHWNKADVKKAKEELAIINADVTPAKDMNLPDEVKDRLKAARRNAKHS